MSKIKVFGVGVSPCSESDFIDKLDGWVRSEMSQAVAFCNVHSLITAAENDLHRAALDRCAVVAPDGAPIAWMLRRLGVRGQKRLSGPDAMLSALAWAQTCGWRVFFLGGSHATQERLIENLGQMFPRLIVAGRNSPPFRALSKSEEDALVEQINSTNSQLVLVSLGCPKQEAWMADHIGRVRGVMLGVGAAFDFHAGTVMRAPSLFRFIGMEWLFRLLCEPRRLFARYAKTNTKFVSMVISWYVRG